MEDKGRTKCKMLVKDLPEDVFRDLSKHLNPSMTLGGDWRTLGGKFGFKMLDLLNFQRKDDPTLAILQTWMSKGEKFVTDLIEFVNSMKRKDVVDILEPYEYCEEIAQKQPTDKKSLENDLPPDLPNLLVLPSDENLVCESSTQRTIRLNDAIKIGNENSSTDFQCTGKAYTVSGEPFVSDDSQDELEEDSGYLENAIVHNRISQRTANVADMSVQTQVPSPTAACPVPQFPTPEYETTNVHSHTTESITAPRDKIALVIGNQNYANPQYNKLSYTQNDAYEIASALEDLDFKVISLADLTLTEMRTSMLAFCRLLGSGIFAVIYYAGHGFELEGENYLIPVDAMSADPNQSIRAQEFLQEMQNCNTLLNLMFLDCCRTKSGNKKAPRCSLKRGTQGNTIIAYSCCTQHGAFEEPNQSNGVYAKYLLENIRRDARIENILMDVSTAVVKSRSVDQRPTYESDAYMECRLTAPILVLPDDVVKHNERYELWSKGNATPLPMVFETSFGEATLNFHKAFSNLMITEVFVTNKEPREIKKFTISVSSCEPLDVINECEKTNIRPMEMDKNVGGFKVLKLQKLWNESLFLSIDFQTEDSSVIKKVDFGTPLITGITGSFHEWIKETNHYASSGASSSWV